MKKIGHKETAIPNGVSKVAPVSTPVRRAKRFAAKKVQPGKAMKWTKKLG